MDVHVKHTPLRWPSVAALLSLEVQAVGGFLVAVESSGSTSVGNGESGKRRVVYLPRCDAASLMNCFFLHYPLGIIVKSRPRDHHRNLSWLGQTESFLA